MKTSEASTEKNIRKDIVISADRWYISMIGNSPVLNKMRIKKLIVSTRFENSKIAAPKTKCMVTAKPRISRPAETMKVRMSGNAWAIVFHIIERRLFRDRYVNARM